MTNPLRTLVLIDGQNVYRSARRVFFDDRVDPPVVGQFNPRPLAEVIVAKKSGRILDAVHVFRGRPDRHIDPRGNSANVRQSQVWGAAGVYVHARPLLYLGANPSPSDGAEKGVDVELAVTLVSYALRHATDCIVVVSADTDLVPAVEEALSHSSVQVELAGWHNGKWGQRLTVPSRKGLWCHMLDLNDYRAVEDSTTY